jgi:DNA-binding transcriptional LysR family regulator
MDPELSEEPGELRDGVLLVPRDHAGPGVELRGDPPERVAVRPCLATNRIDVAIDACLAGAGWVQVLGYQVAEPLAAGRLRRSLARRLSSTGATN